MDSCLEVTLTRVWQRGGPDVGGRGAKIRIRRVTHGYRSGGEPVPVLGDLDLDLAAGGYLSLMGSSGTGKSTLLALIGGLERPQHGEVRVGGRNLAELTGNELARYRRCEVGLVLQHFGLLKGLTALENVELAMMLEGLPPRERRPRARGLLDAVGLGGREGHLPTALSGGERQRVAIARAIANRPRLILADEPTGNLDSMTTKVILELLNSLRSEYGCSLLVVTHNPVVAAAADHRCELINGRVQVP